MVHFDESFLKISFDEAANCVVMEWKSFATSDEFRKGLNEGLKLIEQMDATNWLADLREMGAIDPDDEEWSNTDWFPRALSAGINRMAIVPSSDIFNSLSVENIMNAVEGTNLITHYFKEVQPAREWLRQQQEELA
jgi:hypothetical protein